MPTRDYHESLVEHIREDQKFAVALFEETMQAFIDGERNVALTLLRSIVNALVTFPTLAEETGLHVKALHRMLSKDGNPRAESLMLIISAVVKRLPEKRLSIVTRAPASRRRRRTAQRKKPKPSARRK